MEVWKGADMGSGAVWWCLLRVWWGLGDQWRCGTAGSVGVCWSLVASGRVESGAVWQGPLRLRCSTAPPSWKACIMPCHGRLDQVSLVGSW